jgi:hypothetical protein
MVEICERGNLSGMEWTLPEEYVRAFVEVYNVLGFGSAFFHACGTCGTGAAIDVVPIDFFALLFVQGSLSSLEFNPVLHELRLPEQPARQYTAYGYVDAMTEMVSAESVYEWKRILDAFDAPNQYVSFGAFVALNLDVLFLDRPDLSDAIMELVGPLILTPSQLEFLLEVYVPEVRSEIIAKIPFGGEDRAALSNMFMGTLMKMMFAFYWQEQIVDGDHLYDIEAIQRGAANQPVCKVVVPIDHVFRA